MNNKRTTLADRHRFCVLPFRAGALSLAWLFAGVVIFSCGVSSLRADDSGVFDNQSAYEWRLGASGSTVSEGERLLTPETDQGFVRWVTVPSEFEGVEFNNNLSIVGNGLAALHHQVRNGRWLVKVVFYSQNYHEGMLVRAEGVLRQSNIRQPHHISVDAEFLVDVADGVLNLEIDDADLASTRYSISTIELTYQGDVPPSPGTFSLLTPANNTSGLGPQALVFNWEDASGALEYEFFLWEGGTRPETPTQVVTDSQLTQDIYFGKTYTWQIIARSLLLTSASDIYQFTTADLKTTGEFDNQESYYWNVGPGETILKGEQRLLTETITEGFAKWSSTPSAFTSKVIRNRPGNDQHTVLQSNGDLALSHTVRRGWWNVRASFFDTMARDNLSIIAEGMEAVSFIRHLPFVPVTEEFFVEVLDGELNLTFIDTDSDKAFSLSGLQLTYQQQAPPATHAANTANTIRGSVWVDANQDGVRQVSEENPEGIKVKLFYDKNEDGIAERKVLEAHSDALGNYAFSNLPDGRYQVGISLLDLPERLMRITEIDEGANDTMDNDINPDTLKSDFILIAEGDTSFTHVADIGLLEHSIDVIFKGEVANYLGQPAHKWNYHDVLFQFQDIGQDPMDPAYVEKVSRWIRWYIVGERIFQEMDDWPDYLDLARFENPNGIQTDFSSKQFRTLYGQGAYAGGRGNTSSGINPEKLLSSDDDLVDHIVMFYETTRGTNPHWKHKGTWPSGARLTHHVETAMMLEYLGGREALRREPTLNGWGIDDIIEGHARWERSGQKLLDIFPPQANLISDYEVNQESIPFPDPDNPGRTITVSSRGVLQGILVHIIDEQGWEKGMEVLRNISSKKWYSPDIKEAIIHFKQAVNDATDGHYSDDLVNRWGFPVEEEYIDNRAVDSGPFIDQDEYKWDCKPHNIDSSSIRDGYGHLSDQTTQGIVWWSQPGSSKVIHLGGISEFESADNPSDAFSSGHLKVGYGIKLSHRVSNGLWLFQMDTKGTAIIPIFPNDILSPIETAEEDGILVEVTDGLLEVEFILSDNNYYHLNKIQVIDVGGICLRKQIVQDTPLLPVSLVAPTDGAVSLGGGHVDNNYASNVPFDWEDVAGATIYDLFVWTGGVRPETSLARLSESQFNEFIYLQAGETYQWQVIARNAAFESESEVFSFTTRGHDTGAFDDRTFYDWNFAPVGHEPSTPQRTLPLGLETGFVRWKELPNSAAGFYRLPPTRYPVVAANGQIALDHQVRNGRWSVKVNLHDWHLHDNLLIRAEGLLQAEDIDQPHHSSRTREFTAIVLDGVLNLEFDDADTQKKISINTMELTWLGAFDWNVDDDGDGELNGIEYILGSTDLHKRHLPPLTIGASGSMEWNVPYNPNSVADWCFEISDDLETWTAYTLTDSDRVSADSSGNIATFTFPNQADDVRSFMRLKVFSVE